MRLLGDKSKDGVYITYTHFNFTTPTAFFEECIKEEEYRSQKLELLRDAVHAKPAYASLARKLSQSDLGPISLEHTNKIFDPIPEVVNGTNGVASQ